MGYRYGAECFDDQHAQAEAWCAGASGDGLSCNSCWEEGGSYSCEFHNIITGSYVYLNPGWSACDPVDVSMIQVFFGGALLLWAVGLGIGLLISVVRRVRLP